MRRPATGSRAALTAASSELSASCLVTWMIRLASRATADVPSMRPTASPALTAAAQLSLRLLQSVLQSSLRSQFVFRHLNLKNEMQIGAQMRMIGIPHFNNSKLRIEMQIEMKWYIFQSRQIATLKRKLR